MKALITAIVFVMTFVATVLLLLFLTGNLNRESLARLRGGGEETAPVPVAEEADETSALLTTLREKEVQLAEREAAVQEEEKRLALLRKELESLRDSLETMQKKVNESMDSADEAINTRMETVARSLASMEAKNAAQTLTSEMFTPDEAAMILQRIEEDRKRGEILNEMPPDEAAVVLQALKKRTYGS